MAFFCMPNAATAVIMAKRTTITNHWYVSVEAPKKQGPLPPRSPYWRETKSFPTAGEAKQFAKAMVVRKIGGHSRYVEPSPAEAAYDHSFENRSMDRRKGKRVPKIDAAASHFSPLISRARYIYRSGRHGKPDIQ
jgi:hypothetical protein